MNTYTGPDGNDGEERHLIPVSDERLLQIIGRDMTLHDAFAQSEFGYVFIAHYLRGSGNLSELFAVPQKNYLPYNAVSADYQPPPLTCSDYERKDTPHPAHAGAEAG